MKMRSVALTESRSGRCRAIRWPATTAATRLAKAGIVNLARRDEVAADGTLWRLATQRSKAKREHSFHCRCWHSGSSRGSPGPAHTCSPRPMASRSSTSAICFAGSDPGAEGGRRSLMNGGKHDASALLPTTASGPWRRDGTGLPSQSRRVQARFLPPNGNGARPHGPRVSDVRPVGIIAIRSPRCAVWSPAGHRGLPRTRDGQPYCSHYLQGRSGGLSPRDDGGDTWSRATADRTTASNSGVPPCRRIAPSGHRAPHSVRSTT